MSETLQSSPLIVRPADFDVFRNELLDIPEQACSGMSSNSLRKTSKSAGRTINGLLCKVSDMFSLLNWVIDCLRPKHNVGTRYQPTAWEALGDFL